MPDTSDIPADGMADPRFPDPADALVTAIRDRRAILFAGAGVSMNFGLPSWRALTEHLIRDLGLDPALIDRPDISYQTFAEYYRLQRHDMGALRTWFEEMWVPRDETESGSAIYDLIVTLDFPIIYTTNFDRNLEAAYERRGRDYLKVVGAHDVARASEHGCQIVKFHGDLDDPDSLVLTESDHFDRLAFDSPLDIKFR